MYTESNFAMHAHLRLLLCLPWALPAVAMAETAFVRVQADRGCAVMITPEEANADKQMKVNIQRRWNGACVQGLAEGPGVLTTMINDARTMLTSHFSMGKPYGFYKAEHVSPPLTVMSAAAGQSDSYDFSTVNWGFNGGDPALEFRFKDMGFSPFDPLKVDHNYVLLRASSAFGDKSLMHVGGLGTLILSHESCIVHDTRFADCGFEDGKRRYKVWAVKRYPAGSLTQHDIRSTLCPDPLSAASCELILRDEVERFASAAQTILKVGRPIVEVIAEGSARSLRRQATLDAAQAAQQAAAEGASAAAAEPLVASWLDSAGVGELWARADELIEAKRLDDARTTLRKLITRFPNHGFATKAADSLASLPRN